MDRERIQKLLRGGRDGVFVTTHWSMILAAAGDDPSRVQPALAELCSAYWYPLYAYARRLGHAPEDAEDLVQGFFARVLPSGWLQGASPERGRFRSWVLASFQHHLADERDRAAAQKRGAGKRPESIDALDAEARFGAEPRDERTPENLFDRRWALTVLDWVVERLRATHQAEGKGEQFAVLEQALPGGSGELSYREIAERLRISEGAVKVAVHRLRERYRQTLREEIGRTVESPDQVDEEIRYLMLALGGG